MGYELGKVHVCNDAHSFEWLDHLDWQTYYSFKCLEKEPEVLGAMKTFVSFAAAASVLYLTI